MTTPSNPGISTTTDKLILYFHHYSYYSQKVLMVLFEKGILFEKRIVDIVKGNQYKPTYLAINPRGEVPALQDGTKIVTDSIRIIDYIEDKFSKGNFIKLIPLEENSTVQQKVIHFRNIIDQLPIRTLTMGSFFHSELIHNPKLPFIGPVRNLLANSEKNIGQLLRKCAEENPNYAEVLIQKAEYHEGRTPCLINKNEYLRVVQHFENALDQVEIELNQHTKGQEKWWLCCENFTLADVALTVLLERLNQLGYESRFWKNNQRPNIEKYYQRVKQRDSYKNIIPTNWIHTNMFINTYQKPLIIGISLSIVAGMTALYFIIKAVND